MLFLSVGSMKRLVFLLMLLTLGTFGGYQHAYAHEVYVLTEDEIATALEKPTVNPLLVVKDHLAEFMLWGYVVAGGIAAVFFFSLLKPVEQFINPLLLRIKHYAPPITQVTLGLALLVGGWYGAAFGIELPFTETFGTAAFNMRVIFMILGACFIFGIYPRIASILTGAVLLPYVFQYGAYMLNYATYFGEVLTLILFGGSYSIIKTKENRLERSIERHFHKYKFLMLRIFFGVSLIFASVYAKLIHSALALETVTKYNLTKYFHFEPSFLVLGAMIIEILVGLFILIGFEVRFASLVLLIFLTLSITFFGEAVWPHIMLIGTAMAMFTHGYDKYTVSGYFNHQKDLEPVL